MQEIITTTLEDAKAQDIRVLNVKDMSDITDTMIVASGTSDRHVKALANHVQDALREEKYRPLGVEGQETADWVLLDYGDIIVHVMRESTRQFYDLEGLWGEDVRRMVQANRDQSAAE